jgi:hypothetical protein
MSKSATRLLTFAIYATTLVMVPMATPVKAATNSSEEEKAKKKIQTNSGFSDPRSVGRAGASCSRSIDCEKWPPPISDDPDRKSGGGGGM